MPGIRHAAQPNCYRCSFKLTYPSCEVQCAWDVEEIIQRTTSGQIAAFIRRKGKTATKSKRVSVGKRELQETAEAVTVAALEGVAGLVQAIQGVEELRVARAVAAVSRDALAAGASDVTRGVDQIEAAEGLSKISEVVAAAGVVDLTGGAEILAESQDVEVQSEIVRALGKADLEFAMAIAAIAGQMTVVSDIAAMRDLPVLAVFLDDKGAELHNLAVDSIVRFGATRAVAKCMAQTAARVGKPGAGEMVEGMARAGVATGVAEVAAGADLLGQARALDATAGALAARAE
jgi:hypothetical protein